MQNASSLVLHRLSLPLFLLFSLVASAQPPPSPGQNFIRVERPRLRVSSEKELTLLSAEEKATTYYYFDGLGRKVMATAVQAGPNFEDVVQPYYYPPVTGKQDRTYLGYAKKQAKPGQYVADAYQAAHDFYANPP
ncbi:MAG: DUF6443 domain-containing protein, partial [Bacteroidota bacterium]